MRRTFTLLAVVAVLLRWAHCAGSLSSSHRNRSNESSLMNSSHFCAPGLEGDPCECVAQEYRGLLTCKKDRAFVIPGYWVGECENGTLCTGNCPFGFCLYNGSKEYRLPESMSELDRYICGETRTGVLCGKCQPGYSVSYHSYTYTCTSNDNCKYGWLLYIVSELLPLTIVFIIVMAFNISFTSGGINGFILFAQLQDSLAVQGGGIIRLPSKTFYFATYELIYRFFNFEFFSIEELSFCLWKGAKVLDAVAFKYVTIVIGLVLMFLCVLIMNSTKLKKLFSCLRLTTLKSSLIHGLTAFFVMCYSQCARVSYHILGSVSLDAKDDVYVKRVVFRSGQLSFFETAHLIYAIPAIFFMFTLLLLPPFVLIMHPLLGKCLACCGLSESKFANYVSQLVPIQLLDSFQSCFKDEVRFFAGLYFLYRLFPLIAFSLSFNLADFYTALNIFFIFVFVIHAIVQPYTRRLHNVIDFLLFGNLATINALTLLHYHKIVQGRRHHLSTFFPQLGLIYLPLVCLLVLGVVKLLKFFVGFLKRKCWLMRQKGSTLLTDSCNLPPLREE